MRIVILGGNGQVAAEVALMLANIRGIDVCPVARSKGGSAFLRFHGVSVIHGSITDPKQARLIQEGADVIANFALASGTPAAAFALNQEIIRQSFESSPKSAKIVFFSTLSVHGQYDAPGQHRQTFYGTMKRRNEKQVLALAKRLNRRAYILRLGHVAGVYQNITQLIRQEVLSPPILMIDRDRHSNVTHTVTIADALCAIGNNKVSPPGVYDLVNIPQWSWRQVFAHEADLLGVPLEIEDLDPGSLVDGSRLSKFKQCAMQLIKSVRIKDQVMRFASRLPRTLNESLKAEYYVSRARSEIEELKPITRRPNPAMFWPAITTTDLAGLRKTHDLFATNAFPLDTDSRQRWPPDAGTLVALQRRPQPAVRRRALVG